MKISPHWLREFVSVKVDDRKLTEDLTLAGIAVENISADGAFEMEITTNRPDAMNHYGIAREASAIYDADLKPLSAKLPRAKGMSNFQVVIEVPQYCARFTGQVIRNVKIGPSGARVMKRFKELAQKPINNAADATNYVLLEMGKPTHAFDLDKIDGGKLIIRLARAGETLKTLDGVERKLHPEDVVVADVKKPVALAGIMGGWDSMITPATKNIVIESAWFDPTAIRRSSKRHLIHTDASHRFERGADWATCPLSVELVAEIILESVGELEGALIDIIAREVRPQPTQLRLSEVRRILGKEIPAPEIERILRRLGFTLTTKVTGTYKVEIPTWRLDVEREIDVIEEIARIHGFNQFPNTLPAFQGGLVELPHAPKTEKIRRTLLALGYNEAISSTFVAKTESQSVSSDEPVIIANPLSEEAGAMRTSLVPGMLDMVARNLNRGTADVRLFEAGHIFSMNGSNTAEKAALCFAATASAISPTQNIKDKDATEAFRRFKGDIETLLGLFESSSLYFDTNSGEYYHPGRGARAVLNGATVARFGQLHPDLAASRKLKQDVYLAEVALDRLLQIALNQPRYQKLSRFPVIDRDFSFIFPDAVTFERITSAIKTLQLADLTTFDSVEIFRGGSVPTGQYSTLLRAVFQSNEHTLRDEEVAQWSQKIVNALKSLGGTQRA